MDVMVIVHFCTLYAPILKNAELYNLCVWTHISEVIYMSMNLSLKRKSNGRERNDLKGKLSEQRNGKNGGIN